MEYFKKARSFLLVLLFTAGSVSCSSPAPPSASPSGSQPSASPSPSFSVPSQEPSPSAEETPSYTLTAGELIDFDSDTHALSGFAVSGLYKNQLILLKNIQHVDDAGNYVEGSDNFYYVYNLQTGQMKEIGCIEWWYASSGDYIIMGDYYYYSTSVRNSPYQLLLGINLDGGPQKIIENDQTYFPPFQYFSQLNEREFTVYGPQAVGESVYEYYIRTYNIETGEYKEIIRTGFDKNLQEGEMITDICCGDNKIYAYSIEGGGKSGELGYTIKVFDGDGKLLETRSAETIQSGLRGDSTWGMRAYGDYLIIRTMSLDMLVYKYQNGTYIKVNKDRLPARNGFQLGGDQNGYMYSAAPDGSGINILDVYSEKIYFVEVKLDEQCPYAGVPIVDAEGNLVMRVFSSNSDDEDVIVKYYYVSHEEILKTIGKG